jgi:hypothetical protein
MKHSDLFLTAETMQNTLVGYATSDKVDSGDYSELRSELLSHTELKALIPEYVITCRSLRQFWAFIKEKFARYDERRQFVWSTFAPLLNYLERPDTSPVDAVTGLSLKKMGQAYIASEWEKCLYRRTVDPEAAITSSRSLLETVLKYILDELSIEHKESDDLPKLYRKAADSLNLSPDKHNEEVFKQILGGMTTVVNGFASLRNKYGDAHGKGKKYVRPSDRHAQLAVNLTGAICTFLFETFEYVKEKKEWPS